MEKEILKISPFFEARIWGGDRMLKTFNYDTDVFPVGEVYNVVALPGEADCPVEGTNMTLSEMYTKYPEWFKCDTQQLPIRVNLLDPLSDLSVQLHPDDDYALVHDQSRGKPEAWVILDTPKDGKIEFGHHAKTKEEFTKLAKNNDWGNLLKYLPAKKDYFIDIPAGTLHAIGRDVLTYNISRNADLTYRLYDYNRVDPKTKRERELHIDKVIDNVIVPDNSKGFIWYEPYLKDGCEITDYWDEPGLYTLSRVKIGSKGFYTTDRFAFITIVEGQGKINDVHVSKGETVLIPDSFGKLCLFGQMDMFIASYKNLEEKKKYKTNSVEVSYKAAIELAAVLKKIDTDQVNKLVSLIRNKQRIFVTGAGRSLLMLKGFAMRLMHIGFEVYVVGEVTTPAFRTDDLLIVASASGETKSLVFNANRAKEYGGTVAVLSIFENSSLGKIADEFVKIPAYTDKLPESESNKKGILPGGSTFEEAVLLLGDSLIVELANEYKIDIDRAFQNHANLE